VTASHDNTRPSTRTSQWPLTEGKSVRPPAGGFMSQIVPACLSAQCVLPGCPDTGWGRRSHANLVSRALACGACYTIRSSAVTAAAADGSAQISSRMCRAWSR
jgi:hypothetical protein